MSHYNANTVTQRILTWGDLNWVQHWVLSRLESTSTQSNVVVFLPFRRWSQWVVMQTTMYIGILMVSSRSVKIWADVSTLILPNQLLILIIVIIVIVIIFIIIVIIIIIVNVVQVIMERFFPKGQVQTMTLGHRGVSPSFFSNYVVLIESHVCICGFHGNGFKFITYCQYKSYFVSYHF